MRLIERTFFFLVAAQLSLGLTWLPDLRPWVPVEKFPLEARPEALFHFTLVMMAVILATADGLRVPLIPVFLSAILSSLEWFFRHYYSKEFRVNLEGHLPFLLTDTEFDAIEQPLWILNFSCLLLSLCLVKTFGEGDFSSFKPFGKFSIGFQEFKFGRKSNLCSVFYPMDETKYVKSKDKFREWIRADSISEFLRGVVVAFQFNREILGIPTVFAPIWMILHWRSVRYSAAFGGKVAFAFQSFKTDLRPIVLSHGFGMSRLFYQLLGCHLASCGFVVFLVDHHDGSCAYTEAVKSTRKLFMFHQFLRSPKDVTKKGEAREKLLHDACLQRSKEILELLDLMTTETFHVKVLKFDVYIKIRLDKVIMIGHQLGGAAALKVAMARPEDIKCLVLFDSWFSPAIEDLRENVGKLTNEQSLLMINSSSFTENSLLRAMEQEANQLLFSYLYSPKCKLAQFKEFKVKNASCVTLLDFCYLNQAEFGLREPLNQITSYDPEPKHTLNLVLILAFLKQTGNQEHTFNYEKLTSELAWLTPLTTESKKDI